MRMPGGPAEFLSKISELLRLYYTVDEKLKQIDSNFKQLEHEFTDIRIEHVKLDSRLAKLEAGHDKIQAEVRLEIERAINQIQMQYMSTQLEAACAHNAALLTAPTSAPEG